MTAYKLQRCGMKIDCEKLSKDFTYVSSTLTKAQARIAELENKLTNAATTIKRRLASDEACGHPFDEDLSEVLKAIGEG